MRVMYYCPEYFLSHGGRTHAREFFAALANYPDVEAANVFQPANRLESEYSSIDSVVQNKPNRTWLPLPLYIQKAIRYWLPKYRLTDQLVDAIHRMNADTLIVRTGARNPLFSVLRRKLPELSICLEVNAAYFDEMFPAVPIIKPLLQRLEVKRYRIADAICVVSSYLRDYLVDRGLEPSRILINHNGVNEQAFSSMPAMTPAAAAVLQDIPKASFVIGYVGGMERFRRLPELVRHFANLVRQGNRDFFLLIVGDGADRPNVTAEIERNQDIVGGCIRCVGWQPHDAIPAIMSRFSIAVFPFTNPYCSPLKLFEYLGCGLPTIGPDTPAVRDVFEHGTHLLLARQDGSDFEKLVTQLYESPALRAELAQLGRNHVLKEYTWRRNVERMLGLLRSQAAFVTDKSMHHESV